MTTEPQTATERRLTEPGTPARIVADEIHFATGYDEIHCDHLAINSVAALHSAGFIATTDQTPDAVRAAIAWVLAGFAGHDAFEPELIHAIYDSKAAAIYARLVQIGAVPEAGSVTTTDCPNCNGKGREQRIGDAGPNSLCNRCGGRGYVIGALRPVGVTFTDDELATIARALRNEAQGIGSYPVACRDLLDRLPIPDAAARAGDGAT